MSRFFDMLDVADSSVANKKPTCTHKSVYDQGDTERPASKSSFFAFAEELFILILVELSVVQQLQKIGRIAHAFLAQKHLDDVFDADTKASDETDGSQKDEVGIIDDKAAEQKDAAENERP